MKKILLADDSITIQKVVELTFSELDYEVTCVGNGSQALKKIAEIRPDLVLLDVIMPEKNGYEVCELIKRNPSTSGIPVLLLTGTFEPFDKKRAELAGADGHLTKPFESQSLVAKVGEMIAATPSVASAEEAGPMDIISGGDVYHVDPDGDQGTMSPISGEESTEAAAAAPAAVAPPPREGASPSLPAMPSEAPDPGGSYVGFADVGFGGDEAIVPDRFEESVTPPSATVRLRRDAIPGAKSAPPAAETMTGNFEPQFTLIDDEPAPPAAVAGGDATVPPEDAWTPPPEAPPAETWQESEASAPSAPERPSPGPSAAGNGAGVALTPEAIELIAERVVARMSDRVVREIAWEILPEVAEALVRRRIKELEENPSG